MRLAWACAAPDPVTRARGYRRVSTTTQAESQLGLEDQLHAIEAYCREHGLDLVATYTDAGASGLLPVERRPALMDLLTAAEDGDVVVVARRDRAGRDPTELAIVERDLAKRGARLVSCAGEGTADDSMDSVFLRRVVDAMAEREVALIAARTRAALRALRRRGYRAGGVPFGYRIDPDTPKGHPEYGKLFPEPQEQRIIQLVLSLRESGLSYRKVAARLEAQGVVSPRSKRPLGKTQVARICKAAEEAP